MFNILQHFYKASNPNYKFEIVTTNEGLVRNKCEYRTKVNAKIPAIAEDRSFDTLLQPNIPMRGRVKQEEKNSPRGKFAEVMPEVSASVID